jgi:hypothetical protein
MAMSRPRAVAQKTKRGTFGSDIRMGLGLEKQTPSFRARSAITRKKQEEMLEQSKRNEKRRERRRGKRLSAQMLFEQEKAEKLEEERAEGQKRRKAFEKAQGERYARRRRLLMNI